MKESAEEAVTDGAAALLSIHVGTSRGRHVGCHHLHVGVYMKSALPVRCEHTMRLRLDGLCKHCASKKPYLVYTADGYRWGPGHGKKVGERPYWSERV